MELLVPLLDDKVDFVRQGALVASAMLLMQRAPETDAATEAFRAKMMAIIADSKGSSTMTRLGAFLASGIIDAGGRNVRFSLLSRAGVPKPPAVAGIILWAQYWFWYPMLHTLSLCFSPSALIGVNKNLDIPKAFTVKIEGGDPLRFNYPDPTVEKKEEKKERIKTVQLSTTAHSKAKEKVKEDVEMKPETETKPVAEVKPETGTSDSGMDIVVNPSDTATTEENKKVDADAAEKAKIEEMRTNMLKNPLRIQKIQEHFVSFTATGDGSASTSAPRYIPACNDSQHCVGIVVLSDNNPEEPEDVVKVAVPPTQDEEGGGVEPDPPEPFIWSPPPQPKDA
jgi:26S proteasome regulatory subunit N2